MLHRLIIRTVLPEVEKVQGTTAPDLVVSKALYYGGGSAFTFDFIDYSSQLVGLAMASFIRKLASNDWMTYQVSAGRDADDPNLDRPNGPIETFKFPDHLYDF